MRSQDYVVPRYSCIRSSNGKIINLSKSHAMQDSKIVRTYVFRARCVGVDLFLLQPSTRSSRNWLRTFAQNFLIPFW